MLLFVANSYLSAAQTPEDAFVGTWLTAEKDSKVQIYKVKITDKKTNEVGYEYRGKIAWLAESREKMDINNPDDKQKKDALIGKNIMKGFKYNAKNKTWEGGTLYKSGDGKTYEGYAQMNPDGSLYLKGYIMGIKALGKSSNWTRVKE